MTQFAIGLLAGQGGRRGHTLIQRNLTANRHSWMVIFSGFFEPLFYLFSLGVGLGALVSGVEVGGHALDYTSFVAPALLAASAMNGAINDSTFNVFWKLKHAKLYDSVLASPLGPVDVALGEIGWAVGRGVIYSAAFLVIMAAMGLVHSTWAVLIVPAALVEAFAFAGCGMAGTTFMRSWQDFEWVALAILPMFLFSATFFPLSTYPPALRVVVEWTPLYQGVALVRGLSTGAVSAGLLWHVAYLLILGGAGVLIAARRLGRLLLP